MLTHRFLHLFRQSPAIIAACCLLSAFSMAQPPVSQDQRDEVEARRIGFITNEVQLSPEEAQVFWPVYNKYRDELEALRKDRANELMSAKINFDSYTDEQVSKVIDNEFNSRQKELDIARKYNTEFKKILPVKKVAKLYRAEQLFKISLLKDMRQDKGGKPMQPPGQKN
ncbi:MAG: hypothetical protein K1X61_12555 [Chitinophagales bacterium]|nr:hypothetical protein [Chitinophagales bacterium]